MFSTELIVIAIISAAIWIYDTLVVAPKRKKENLPEPKYIPYARGVFLVVIFIYIVKVLNFNILTLLTILTIASGVIWFIDVKYFKAKRVKEKRKENFIIDYSRSLFWIFLVVLIIRAFVAQLFTIPTGSLEPTIMPGDIIVANQFDYGLRLPITHTKIIGVGEPKVGDIAVFRYPAQPSIDYIKRIVGVPGDHVVYKNKILYINGKEAKQTFIEKDYDFEPGNNMLVNKVQENLQGVKHDILIRPAGYGETSDFDVTVPKGYYFGMGDNRDDSADSRFWGFIPEKNLIGKAMFILVSWDKQTNRVRWHRTGDKL